LVFLYYLWLAESFGNKESRGGTHLCTLIIASPSKAGYRRGQLVKKVEAISDTYCLNPDCAFLLVVPCAQRRALSKRRDGERPREQQRRGHEEDRVAA
jgi:hypothetical protein